MKLHRWSGAGNTFLIMDAWNQNLPSKQYRAKLAEKLCRAFPNAKTDGLVFLDRSVEASVTIGKFGKVIEPGEDREPGEPEEKKSLDFQWDFYNDDGSHAEMCGNAARCAIAHFHQFIEKKNLLRFLTGAGIVEGEIKSATEVQVLMPPFGEPGLFIEDGVFYINTGVPHIVLEREPDTSIAKFWRPKPDVKGSNVTFVTDFYKQARAGAKAVTFERGVEDYTAACGTGATAAAAYLQSKTGLYDFAIQMPGGILQVKVPKNSSDHPILTGPVELQYMLDL